MPTFTMSRAKICIEYAYMYNDQIMRICTMSRLCLHVHCIENAYMCNKRNIPTDTIKRVWLHVQ